MLDLSDLSSGLTRLVLSLLRGFWWLAWDFAVQTIGWTIGWLFWRVVTVGRFPREALGDIDEAPWFTRLIVDLTGLAVIAAGIWLLSGLWPRL